MSHFTRQQRVSFVTNRQNVMCLISFSLWFQIIVIEVVVDRKNALFFVKDGMSLFMSPRKDICRHNNIAVC